MATNRQYRWKPAPWRVGEDGATPPPASSTPPEEGGKKKTGTIALVLVGAAAVAFGVMELLGITKVFAPAPAVPVLPPGSVTPTGAVPAPAPAAPK